ncbi:hypothetical protein [Fischerella sp.]|jgi:hypothetical protein|nr:hypothetical protein [Fischerella sp.]
MYAHIIHDQIQQRQDFHTLLCNETTWKSAFKIEATYLEDAE